MAIVIMTEKPSVGREIARIVGARKRGSGYIEGGGYIVTWAYGHLVELMEPEDYDASLKRWNLSTLPIIPEKFKLKAGRGKGVKEQLNTVKRLFREADAIICATDAGREGELIFRYILEVCRCKSKPIERLWISSMTDSAIREGLSRLKPLSHYDNLAMAARCRSEADWIVGMNATRGYTIQHSRGRGVFSVGRVQTPVLAMIVRRDEEIRTFVPEDYWELWTNYRNVGFKHIKERFPNREEAEELCKKVLSSDLLITQVEEKKQMQPPPQLFDLTELQRAMNRSCGYSASSTLQYCQSLYEKKAITYPRTDSRYLSDDIYEQCPSILQKLSSLHGQEVAPLLERKLTKSKRVFNSSKVTDHHAIIPTGLIPRELSPQEQRLFLAIAIRFIAVFYPDCEKAITKVSATAAEESFTAKGTRIVQAGWLQLYKNEKQIREGEETLLPPFTVGERGAHDPSIKACRTNPPHHYSEATLLGAMETAGKNVEDEELKEAMKERGLGTPATRAAIIETLLKREYIVKSEKKLYATAKGKELIDLLEGQPTLTSPEMTAEWEHRLKEVERGRFCPNEFMQKIHSYTREVVKALVEGKSLSPDNLGRCPLCGEAVIRGRTGFGCSAWKSGCPFRFHEEQFGTKIVETDLPLLLARGRLPRPRKLIDASGNATRGYITCDSSGKIGMISCEEKVQQESIGCCPLCRGAVVGNLKCYSCSECDFVIWKKIAGKAISPAVISQLLRNGKSARINGFRSKAGKSFNACLKVDGGKVCFDFSTK